MLVDVVEAEPRGGYRLWLRFEDGVAGEIDLGSFLRFEGVFAPFREPAYFATVRVNQELGTICWPNDADWDPLTLYSLVTGQPIADLLAAQRAEQPGAAARGSTDRPAGPSV